MKCNCIYRNNQPKIKCDNCSIIEGFNRTLGYTEKHWAKNKKQLDRELVIWMRSREFMIRRFDDFIKGCLV